VVDNFDNRIQSTKFRIDAIKTKKAEANAKLELLKQQYDQKVKELKDKGVTDLSNLPKIIADKSKELEDLLESTDVQLKLIESQIQ
jgi:hypothetical protein